MKFYLFWRPNNSFYSDGLGFILSLTGIKYIIWIYFFFAFWYQSFCSVLCAENHLIASPAGLLHGSSHTIKVLDFGPKSFRFRFEERRKNLSVSLRKKNIFKLDLIHFFSCEEDYIMLPFCFPKMMSNLKSAPLMISGVLIQKSMWTFFPKLFL